MKKRTKGILVRFTEDEKKTVKNKALAAGYNVEAFCRESILHGTVTPRPTLDFHEFTAQLRYLGNNLNQVTALAHTKGFIDKVRLNALIDALWELEKEAGEKIREAG